MYFRLLLAYILGQMVLPNAIANTRVYDTFVVLEQNTTWRGSDTILVRGQLTVPPNITLTIEPQCKVIFTELEGVSTYSIDVFGTLISAGTRAQPIQVSAHSSVQGIALGILIDSHGCTESIDNNIRFVKFNGLVRPLEIWSDSDINYYVSDCTFENWGNAIRCIVSEGEGEINIQRCMFGVHSRGGTRCGCP